MPYSYAANEYHGPTSEPDMLWKVSVNSISLETYKTKFLGTNFVDDEDAGPPFADVEWSIHPGSLVVFATVMTSTCMSSRKVSGLVVEVEREPKSRRIISVTTNASPALEAFILSIVSHSAVMSHRVESHTNNHIRCYQHHVTVLLTGCLTNVIFMSLFASVYHHAIRCSS